MKFVKSIQIQLEDIDFVSFLRSAIASLKRDVFSEQSGVVIYFFCERLCFGLQSRTNYLQQS